MFSKGHTSKKKGRIQILKKVINRVEYVYKIRILIDTKKNVSKVLIYSLP